MRAIQIQNDSGDNIFAYVNLEKEPAEICLEIGDEAISITLEDAETLADDLLDLIDRAKTGRE